VKPTENSNHGWKWMTRISTKGSEETGRPVVHIRLLWRVGEKRDGHKKAQRRTKILIKAQLSLLMGSAGNEQRRREDAKNFNHGWTRITRIAGKDLKRSAGPSFASDCYGGWAKKGMAAKRHKEAQKRS